MNFHHVKLTADFNCLLRGSFNIMHEKCVKTQRVIKMPGMEVKNVCTFIRIAKNRDITDSTAPVGGKCNNKTL